MQQGRNCPYCPLVQKCSRVSFALTVFWAASRPRRGLRVGETKPLPKHHLLLTRKSLVNVLPEGTARRSRRLLGIGWAAAPIADACPPTLRILRNPVIEMTLLVPSTIFSSSYWNRLHDTPLSQDVKSFLVFVFRFPLIGTPDADHSLSSPARPLPNEHLQYTMLSHDVKSFLLVLYVRINDDVSVVIPSHCPTWKNVCNGNVLFFGQ